MRLSVPDLSLFQSLLYEENSFGVFVLVTVILGGARRRSPDAP